MDQLASEDIHIAGTTWILKHQGCHSAEDVLLRPFGETPKKSPPRHYSFHHTASSATLSPKKCNESDGVWVEADTPRNSSSRSHQAEAAAPPARYWFCEEEQQWYQYPDDWVDPVLEPCGEAQECGVTPDSPPSTHHGSPHPLSPDVEHADPEEHLPVAVSNAPGTVSIYGEATPLTAAAKSEGPVSPCRLAAHSEDAEGGDAVALLAMSIVPKANSPSAALPEGSRLRHQSTGVATCGESLAAETQPEWPGIDLSSVAEDQTELTVRVPDEHAASVWPSLDALLAVCPLLAVCLKLLGPGPLLLTPALASILTHHGGRVSLLGGPRDVVVCEDTELWGEGVVGCLADLLGPGSGRRRSSTYFASSCSKSSSGRGVSWGLHVAGNTLQVERVGSKVTDPHLPYKLALGAVSTLRATIDVYGGLPADGGGQSWSLTEDGPLPALLLPVGMRLPHLTRSELTLKCRECTIEFVFDLPETDIETCACACTGDAIDQETLETPLDQRILDTLTQGKEPIRVSMHVSTSGPVTSSLLTAATAYRALFAAATHLTFPASECIASLLRPHARRLSGVRCVTLVPHRPGGDMSRVPVLQVPAQLLGGMQALQTVCVGAKDVECVARIVKQCVGGRDVEVVDGGAVCVVAPLHQTIVMATLCA